MPFYEHTFIARQDLTPNKVSELADKYAAVIAETRRLGFKKPCLQNPKKPQRLLHDV